MLEIINVIICEEKSEACKARSKGWRLDTNVFLWIAASVVDADAVNPNSLKTILSKGLSTFPIKGNSVFGKNPKNLPQNPPDCAFLCDWFFYYFILAEELFEKAWRSFGTCLLVNNNLCRKLFSLLESPTAFDVIFKVTSVLFFVPNFGLLSCELDNVILILY